MPLFFTFTNREGKMWSIPYKNTSIGFEIYEPSGKKGILLKKYNCLLKSSVFRLFFKIELERIELTDSLMNILQRYYGENFEYSIFYGTPSVDQKITIQIYRGNSILGYCKIGQSMKVQKLFEYEASMLEFLNKKGVKNIPKKTFEGRVGKENVFCSLRKSKKVPELYIVLESIIESLFKSFTQKLTKNVNLKTRDYTNILSFLIKIRVNWM